MTVVGDMRPACLNFLFALSKYMYIWQVSVNVLNVRNNHHGDTFNSTSLVMTDLCTVIFCYVLNATQVSLLQIKRKLYAD